MYSWLFNVPTLPTDLFRYPRMSKQRWLTIELVHLGFSVTQLDYTQLLCSHARRSTVSYVILRYNHMGFTVEDQD